MTRKTKAQMWPELHWSACWIVCLCVPVLAKILVYYDLMTPARAISSSVIAVIFVIVMTWLHTRDRKET